MTKQEILKEQFNKMVYKMKLAEEFGSIFTPFYEKPEYNKNGIIENTIKLYLNEGLITTYPSYKLIDLICKKFNYPQDYVQETNTEASNGIDSRIALYFFPANSLIELKKCIDVCGYYITVTVDTGHAKYKNIFIEPKFNAETFTSKDLIKKFNIKTIFQVSNKTVENKILDKGLCPRKQLYSLDHPERVYFFIQYNEEGFKDFAKQKYNQGDFTIFAIDVNKLPENIIFEPDVAYNGYAIFTKENISPDTIDKIGDFTIEN